MSVGIPVLDTGRDKQLKIDFAALEVPDLDITTARGCYRECS